MSRYNSRGTPFFSTPDVEFAPILLDLLHPRYLYSADAEMSVVADSFIPTVLAFIIGNLMSLIFIPMPVRLLCAYRLQAAEVRLLI